MTFKHSLVVGLIFTLAACGAPPAATPAPTSVAIQVYYPVALQPWADKLASCTSGIPQVGLYFFPSANPADTPISDKISLEIGQPQSLPPGAYPAQIGWEQIVVIVNQANPVSQIATDLLRQVLSGQVTHWQGDPGQSIQVWVMPEGDPIRQIFEQAVGLALPLAPESWFAPDPAAVLEAVSKDEGAIGYLPASYLRSASPSISEGVKIILLEPPLEQALKQPVLAYTDGEPTGYQRDLIVCAQNSGPK